MGGPRAMGLWPRGKRGGNLRSFGKKFGGKRGFFGKKKGFLLRATKRGGNRFFVRKRAPPPPTQGVFL